MVDLHGRSIGYALVLGFRWGRSGLASRQYRRARASDRYAGQVVVVAISVRPQPFQSVT
ncbi:hypothetical protein GS885_23935 [Rhodococcus hoagii]|nr:hypothetical protein [Prescottella equi]